MPAHKVQCWSGGFISDAVPHNWQALATRFVAGFVVCSIALSPFGLSVTPLARGGYYLLRQV